MINVPAVSDLCEPGLERVHYFSRQLLTAEDLLTEQHYHRQKLRRHNRFLHGWGVVCGCDVEAAPDADRPWLVRVCPGYVVGPQGDEIAIVDPVVFDLSGTWIQEREPCARPWPCPPRGSMPVPGQREPVYLAIRFAECDARPVRVHPAGCACEDAACEYSRVREDFELKLLWALPESHQDAAEADQRWCDVLRAWMAAPAGAIAPPPPVPECQACPEEPWVVLAQILLPADAATPIAQANIGFRGRRVLYSASAMQQLVRCLLHGQ